MGNCMCFFVPDDDDECQPVTQPSQVRPSDESYPQKISNSNQLCFDCLLLVKDRLKLSDSISNNS